MSNNNFTVIFRAFLRYVNFTIAHIVIFIYLNGSLFFFFSPLFNEAMVINRFFAFKQQREKCFLTISFERSPFDFKKEKIIQFFRYFTQFISKSNEQFKHLYNLFPTFLNIPKFNLLQLHFVYSSSHKKEKHCTF